MNREEFNKKFARMKELLGEAVVLANECALAAHQSVQEYQSAAREMRDHVEKAERKACEIAWSLKKFPQRTAAA